MITAAIIVGLILVGLIILSCFTSRSDWSFFLGIWVTMFSVIEIVIVSNIIGEPKPTPMDVYQGKTTLEYTIRDGVKIDSVVVFKENNYGKD